MAFCFSLIWLTPWHFNSPSKVRYIDVPEVNMAIKETTVVSALKIAQKLQINFSVLGRTSQSTFDMIFCILLSLCTHRCASHFTGFQPVAKKPNVLQKHVPHVHGLSSV
jgi:hypothetical protein